jgi:sterol 3beta-glucosyltransferase
MKIILASVGTRGDMEPFLAIGQLLKEKGHQVICAFPEQFRKIVNESNIEFASLGPKYINLLERKEGKAAMGAATGFKKIAGTLKLSLKQNDANKELLFKQQELIEREQPDRILYNGKAVYPIIWGLKNKGKTIFVSPLPYMHYVKGHTHVIFNSNFGDFFNRLTFSLAHLGMIVTIRISKKWLKISEKISRKELLDVLQFNKSIYTISPSLFSKPYYWVETLKVLGYHFSSKKTAWHPDKALSGFISKHKKILFITFGSMINPGPEEKTRIFIDILERNKIPAIINIASGGLVKPDNFDSELIYFVSQIPYDWIFPKIYAVIHHGGSGTTHLTLKYGCATMIIPHIIDQFVWNKIAYDKGVGTKILDLINNADYKIKAEQIKSQMKKEEFKEELYYSIIE